MTRRRPPGSPAGRRRPVRHPGRRAAIRPGSGLVGSTRCRGWRSRRGGD